MPGAPGSGAATGPAAMMPGAPGSGAAGPMAPMPGATERGTAASGMTASTAKFSGGFVADAGLSYQFDPATYLFARIGYEFPLFDKLSLMAYLGGSFPDPWRGWWKRFHGRCHTGLPLVEQTILRIGRRVLVRQ